MATTIPSSFQLLQQNLEITGLQKSVVSTRQTKIREVLETELVVLDSFLTGSYARSTMIAPLSKADVDIMIVLDPKYYNQNGQKSLLDKVRSVLIKTYTRTPKISRNGQAVTITFTDFIVDVVPAFNRKGGGYLIPNSISDTWIATNPKVHVNVMSQENKTHNGDLVPLIKMIKGWNREISDSFVSFYLELLIIKILKNVTISSYPSGLRYFFDKGRETIKFKVVDPAGYGEQVNGLRNCTTVTDAVNRFEIAYNRAIRAEEYTKNGQNERAIIEWRKIFGNYFPAYG